MMKKIYNAPATEVVKVRPILLQQPSVTLIISDDPEDTVDAGNVESHQQSIEIHNLWED